MIPIAETLYSDLLLRINELSTEKDILARTGKIVDAIMKVLDQLKGMIHRDGFSGDQEEIQFYKHTKPKFHALYIYHATVFAVESDLPFGGKKVMQKYFRDELKKIDNYFYHNLDLYKYYRAGKTYLDKEYFTRGQPFNEYMIDIVTATIDREFCTLHSVKIAFLIAYQQLRQYLQDAMLEVDVPQKSPVFVTDNPEMSWTDSKTGLVELAYSLHAAGSFNNGRADLKQVTDHLEKSFHVHLGNTSRTFQEILERKKGYTSFLDRLKKALMKRMMEDD